MKKDFTKKDLQEGMVIKYRMGDKALLIGDRFFGKKDWLTLNGYEEDLTHEMATLDIMKVYTITNVNYIHSIEELGKVLEETNRLKLVWQRELPKLNMKELKEIVGFDFEITE